MGGRKKVPNIMGLSPMGWHIPENLRLKRKGKRILYFRHKFRCYNQLWRKNRDKIHGERKGDVKRG